MTRGFDAKQFQLLLYSTGNIHVHLPSRTRQNEGKHKKTLHEMTKK